MAARETIITKYPAGHSYTTTWEKTELYCSQCGKKGLWACRNGGDYYTGEEHYCVKCHCGCYPDHDGMAEDYEIKAREKLK